MLGSGQTFQCVESFFHLFFSNRYLQDVIVWEERGAVEIAGQFAHNIILLQINPSRVQQDSENRTE